MTTTPDTPVPDDKDTRPDADSPERQRAPGAEIGKSEEGGSTFEPEEDAEADR